MGIQKNFVQALFTHSLFDQVNGIFQLKPHHTLKKCNVLILDHSIILHKMMAICDKDEDTDIDECIEFMVNQYIKYGVSSRTWMILMQDGGSFQLKVTARRIRTSASVSQKMREITKDRYHLLYQVYEALKQRRGPCAMAIHGAIPYDKDFVYQILGDDSDEFCRFVKGVGLRCQPDQLEVEADLMQTFFGIEIAQKFPQYNVGIITIDTDVVMILSALACLPTHLPQNLIGFFFNPMIDGTKDMPSLILKHYVEKKFLCCGKLPSFGDLKMSYGWSDENLAFHYGMDSDTIVDEKEYNVWVDIVKNVILPKFDKLKFYGWSDFIRGLRLNGIRGSIFRKLCWLYANVEACEDIVTLLDLLCYGKVIDKGELKILLGTLNYSEFSYSAKEAMFMMDFYRSDLLSFNTYGLFRSIIQLGYFPFVPKFESPKLSHAVLVAIVGGTDYTMPLHKFGLQQMITSLYTPLYTNVIVRYEKLTAKFFSTYFIHRYTCVYMGEDVDMENYWDVFSHLVKTVICGWTVRGYFLNLLKKLRISPNKPINGYIYDGISGSITFALSDDDISACKKNLRLKRCRRIL